MLEFGYTSPLMSSWLACVVALSIAFVREGANPYKSLGVGAIFVGPFPLGAGTK
jgi:hypothetical protein